MADQDHKTISDPEKGSGRDVPVSTASEISTESVAEAEVLMIADPRNRLERLANKFDQLFGLEARGIQQVPESARRGKPTARDYVWMWSIWFSANCTAVQFTAGILGPVSYGLGLVDSML